MIQVDIVTPTRKLLVGEQVESITIPTSAGEIMVLPGHTELVTILDVGGMYLQKTDGMRKFAVSYGFGVVRDNKVTILAETCEESHEIDRDRAVMAQKNAEQMLIETVEEAMLDKYRLKAKRAAIRQAISEPSDR
jgi:F-type H+-transporting ATPase subunit epsilon